MLQDVERSVVFVETKNFVKSQIVRIDYASNIVQGKNAKIFLEQL